ncbi:MAG: hypothetical protein Q8N08_08370 [Methanobacteriaceae archaeon]|nr:hypothetical protein [Methanobacteriaceae archaeon]
MGKNGKNDFNEVEKQKKLSQMNKILSPKRAVIRIIVAIFAFIWFLLGGSAETVLSLSGGAMGLSGLISFFLRNPITFLIMGIINVVLGLILFIFAISSIIVSVLHFLWSIRWFYGFFKYRNVNNDK